MSDEAESTSALNRPGVRVRLIYCVLFLFSMFLALAARGDLYPEVIETLGGGGMIDSFKRDRLNTEGGREREEYVF